MQLSRREFLALAFSGSAAVAACACGGAGLAAYLITRRRSDETLPEISVISTPLTDAAGNVITSPVIVSRADWGGLEPNHEATYENGFFSAENTDGWQIYTGNLQDVYHTVVIHHAAFDVGTDMDNLLEVQRLHRNDRQWADVGYHYLIGKTGTIYEGRPIGVRGVHVGGHNTGSAGICLIGNFMEQTPSPEQLQATNTMVQWLTANLSLTTLGAHRQYNSNTLCPGDNLIPYLSAMATQAGLTFYGSDASTPTPGTSFCGCYL